MEDQRSYFDPDDVVSLVSVPRGEYEVAAVDDVRRLVYVDPINTCGQPRWVEKSEVRLIQAADRRPRCPECGIDLERILDHLDPCAVGVAERETVAGLQAALAIVPDATAQVDGKPIVGIEG